MTINWLSSSNESNISKYKRQFYKHANLTINNEKYMSVDNFVDTISLGDEQHSIKKEQYSVLFRVADKANKKYISFTDFLVLKDLLSKPDSEYLIAFMLFDTENRGKIKLQKFKQDLSSSLNLGIPLDFDTEWFKLYAGRTDSEETEIDYYTFCQMIKGLQIERIKQAFKHFDKNKKGYITPYQFQKIVTEISKYKLSDHIIENSSTLCNVFPGGYITYSNIIAFHNVVRQLDLVEIIINNCSLDHENKEIITKDDFINKATEIAKYTLFTPMEVDIIFHFASIGKSDGKLTKKDFLKILDNTWSFKKSSSLKENTFKEQSKEKSFLWKVLEQVHAFALGSVAGAVGAAVVYPVDLVKTRIQNQRSSLVGQLLYKNSWDCFLKVLKNEGFTGLYSGLAPQLIGVAPEKAIKLTVNDLMRSILTDKKANSISIISEMVSGSIAGASQVIFTNPLEIVKIRLQVQGEITKNIKDVPRKSALMIVKELGLLGLYKGASACLLRDVPFSAIYFTTYSHIKKDYFEETNKKLSVIELLAAGAVAGMPAAYLTTPADVIKTRLQVESKKGHTHYKGITDACKKIYREEGISSFFKGGPARILRSSPQFGCTLMVYELLQQYFPLKTVEIKASNVVMGKEEINDKAELQKSKNALKLLLNLDYKFGLPYLPSGKS